LLELDSIISKTAKGIEEIEANGRTLSPKLRTALILIDGQTRFGELLERMGDQAGPFRERVEDLITRGYLVDTTKIGPARRSTASAEVATPAQRVAVPVQASTKPNAQKEPVSAAAATPPPANAKEPVGSRTDRFLSSITAEQKGHLQEMLVEALGADADKFSGRFWVCRSKEDVLKLLEEVWLPLQNLAGKAKAAAFVKNARMLMGERG